MMENEYLETALRLFSGDLRKKLTFCVEALPFCPEEIRLYTGKCVVFTRSNQTSFALYNGKTSSIPAGDLLIPTENDCYHVMLAACDGSLFYKEDELRRSYVTKNGIRAAFSGLDKNAKLLPGGIRSVILRIPCGAGDLSFPPEIAALLPDADGILIAGPPGSGKTTLLKKCTEILCSGKTGRFHRVSVLDEREELMEFVRNCPGIYTADVLHGLKSETIFTALRLFSPDYILCDEIGGEEEARAMLTALNSGVRFICTAHSGENSELFRRDPIKLLLDKKIFSHILILSRYERGKIDAVYDLREEENARFRRQSHIA